MLTDVQQQVAAKLFAQDWKNRGYEKGESQPFWLALLRNVYGVEQPEKYIQFEEQVHLDHTSFIDGMIPTTHVLIEQKGLGKDLKKPIKQSDGTLLSPYQQAKRYAAELPYSQRPRWIVASNFQEFHIYDMEKPNGEPEVLFLKNLGKEYYRLQFLVDTGSEQIKKEMEISLQAGELVGSIYDALLHEYKNPTNPDTLKSLNMLCVRLVFCLYAEDAGIFGGHSMFHDYLKQFSARDARRALIDLFKVLDTREEDRDPYLDDDLAAFPYVNGGLFADEDIEIPRLNETILHLTLQDASEDFNWKAISPTIFGAVFESTLNPETRRSGGMHYTSIENIHKVIDPLFLDELKEELEKIKRHTVKKTRDTKLKDFQAKLAGLTFLDPACGSGNFLTETYISLRRLENEVLDLLQDGTRVFGFDEEYNPIQVSIAQFYGIEINDFAVTVGKTALWIAESQMMQETEQIVHTTIEFLPLKSYANLIEGNALRMNWEAVVPKDELNYIMGNPPFVGFTFMNPDQKKDMAALFPGVKNLDFVSGWYKIASDYIAYSRIECCFVSTNSITQGETVPRLWQHLNIRINFAYKAFIWESEAVQKAHVHCVIIGFSAIDRKEKWIYEDKQRTLAVNINPYLCDAPTIIVTSRSKPIADVSKMVYGNKPVDGGNLIIEEKDYANFIKQEPQAIEFIRPLLGAKEFLHGKKRWCLWLQDASPAKLSKCPQIMKRVRKCKEVRENSIAAGIRKFAATPTLFAQITQPVGQPFILVPRVSSERRRYVPMSFLQGETIVTDLVQIIPNASMYEFGILTSNVHMAWMRTVCGRLKSDYRYSKDIVYNNFPWADVTDAQKSKIEQTAQAILDARALYPDSTLADLYDEVLMPSELRTAHQKNDRAVMEAYGFNVKTMTESSCVAELMRLYAQKVAELNKV
jgi:hypothetical protein